MRKDVKMANVQLPAAIVADLLKNKLSKYSYYPESCGVARIKSIDDEKIHIVTFSLGDAIDEETVKTFFTVPVDANKGTMVIDLSDCTADSHNLHNIAFMLSELVVHEETHTTVDIDIPVEDALKKGGEYVKAAPNKPSRVGNVVVDNGELKNEIQVDMNLNDIDERVEPDDGTLK